LKVFTYQELEEYIKAFGDGNISLLIIRSDGGLGKSHIVKTILNGDGVFFNGHATPLSIYLTLYEHPDSKVLFDDVDSLLLNKINVGLLKQVCELNKDKVVRYSTTVKIDDKKIEPEFKSNNKACLLCNDLREVGRNLKALLSRAVYLDFVPTNEEILKKLMSIELLDVEILSYIKININNIKSMSLRLYYKLLEINLSGLDWKDYLHRQYFLSEKDLLIKKIKDLPVDQRNKEWVESTGQGVRNLQKIIKRTNEQQKKL
jgi:hypothetical protein